MLLTRPSLFIPLFVVVSCVTVYAGDGNRLAYLDDPINPYYVGRDFPKLTTPMWVGDEGVEAVVVLAIDDMRGHEKWEQYLRPILDRLKQIDGRAPVSIMTCTIDPKEPHLQKWLQEGLSLEVHTIDHPCPLLKDGDFEKAKSTYDRCVDLLASVPNNQPVAFRMPCCDSLNTVSPRFFAEIFNKTTKADNYLQIDSSVFNIFTSNDSDLPRELVIDADGRDKFLKYIPAGRSFVNTIENYPYPYVIGGLCWEFPCVTPSDWQAQNLHKPNNPVTVADLKSALDATVIKQGVFNLVFHPHGWIKPEQIVELIDHAVAAHGRKVKFLTFREALERLNTNLLDRWSLRSSRVGGRPPGSDNGVRLLDVNNDGWMDVLVALSPIPQGGTRKHDIVRLWQPLTKKWRDVPIPPAFFARFGVLRSDGTASAVIPNPMPLKPHVTVYSFDNEQWVHERSRALDLTGSENPLQEDRLVNYCLRDVDGDGRCELIVEYVKSGSDLLKHALWSWESTSQSWIPIRSARIPNGNSHVREGIGRTIRLMDINKDGRQDIVISGPKAYSIHLFDSLERGWSQTVVEAERTAGSRERELPPFERVDQSNNGVWLHSGQLWWQNEDTAKLKDLVDRRSPSELLDDDMPRAKSPDASLKSIHTRPGFEVELLAAEPLVMDPIAFAWGPDGKFWVVEMGDYPLGVDGKGKPGGRVRFLEDSDGDGKYDKSTVFLDELGFPTGVMPWRKGVLVTCAPDIFYAEDTDGDGKADVKRVIFTGFNQGNQQHRVNGLVWGLDGWVYGANGDSGGGIRSPLNPDREPVNISGRDFRMKPDEGLIEAATGQTQFGRARDDWGNWFGCNNSNPLYQFVLPDHYMRRNPFIAATDPRVNVSVVPGASPVYPTSRILERFNDPNTANRFTSACSAIIYRDELFGPQFEGNSFVSEPVHNLIHREVLTPKKGSGVVSADAGAESDAKRGTSPSFATSVTFSSRRAADEQTSEFLASSDNWFRPTTIQTGPDGAIWIADMYRHVIEHPEWIPKEFQERLDLRAGHDMGRIYRVAPAGKQLRPIPRLAELDTAGLVAAMDSPNGWQRDTAHMMLLWRSDRSAITALERLSESAVRPAVRMQALCVLDGLGGLSDALLLRGLSDEHAGVRRHAVRLAESRLSQSPAVAESVLRLAADKDAQVRMQVAFSLGEWDDPAAGRVLGAIALGDSSDPFITAAAASSAAKHAAEILSVLASSFSDAKSGDQALPTALLEQLIGQVVAQRDEAALSRAVKALTNRRDGARPEVWQVNAVAGLFDALDRSGKTVAALRGTASAELKGGLNQLAEMADAARRLASDANAPMADRLAAVRLIGRDRTRDAEDLDTLVKLLTPQVPTELQEAAVSAAVRIRDVHTPDQLLDGWRNHGPRVRHALLDTLLTNESWTGALLQHLEQETVPIAEIDAVHRQRMLDHKSSVVRERSARLFGRASDESRQKLIDAYRPVAQLAGDGQRGATVFQKTCSGCHRIGNVGYEIGPDLSSMANRSDEFFLGAILDPNRAVETRYLSYVAATRDGLVFTGMLATETGNSVTLLAQEGKRQTLLRADIEALQSTGKSLMPDGMERDITPQAMADLLSYLHSAGPPRKSFAGNRPEVVKPELLRHELYLLASTCEIYGSTLVFEDKYKNLGYWSSEDDHAVWRFEVDRPAKYTVTLDYACDNSVAGNSYMLEIGDVRMTGAVPGTGDWDTYKQLRAGSVTLEPGQYRLVFRPAAAISGALLDLRGIRITPAR